MEINRVQFAVILRTSAGYPYDCIIYAAIFYIINNHLTSVYRGRPVVLGRSTGDIAWALEPEVPKLGTCTVDGVESDSSVIAGVSDSVSWFSELLIAESFAYAIDCL